MMYLERLSAAGLDSSKYFAPGEFNTSAYDLQLPNCTLYCYLRAFEACGATKPFPIAKNTLGFGNAKNWFENSPLEKGYEIRTGSIACFDGNYGHVAFVERKIDDTHALISESQYDDDKSLRNYKYWNKKTVELIPGKATLNGVGALQGFLYLPIDDIRTNSGIEIVEEMVNVRQTADGEITVRGCYCPMGFYSVLGTKEVNGYTWYKIDNKCWVREGYWLKYDNELEILRSKLKRIKEIIDE